MAFAAVGIVFGGFLAVGLGQVATAVRQEQLMGTLESLLMTPTSRATIQVGSVAYQLVFLPLRMGVYLALIALAFGLDFDTSGIAPAILVFMLFAPFVWGLGLLSAATRGRRGVPGAGRNRRPASHSGTRHVGERPAGCTGSRRHGRGQPRRPAVHTRPVGPIVRCVVGAPFPSR